MIDWDFRPPTYETTRREIDYPLLGDAPGFGGGGYLPRLRPREVEIAGLALNSTTGDVISIRALHSPEGVRLRVADEYGTRYRLVRAVWERPLSLADLVDLIDTVRHEGQVGLFSTLDRLWEEAEGSTDPSELADFITVISAFYPQLGAVYVERARAWAERHLGEQRD